MAANFKVVESGTTAKWDLVYLKEETFLRIMRYDNISLVTQKQSKFVVSWVKFI